MRCKMTDYLIHFNKNHSKKNGQFDSGDGDGDGIRDDHHNYARNKGDLADAQKDQMRSIVNNPGAQRMAGKAIVGAGKIAAGFAFSKTKLGKTLKEANYKAVTKEFLKATGLDKMYVDTGFNNDVNNFKNKMYDTVGSKASNVANKAIDKYY